MIKSILAPLSLFIILFLLHGCGEEDANIYQQKIEQKKAMEQSLDESFSRNKQRLEQSEQ